jgi:hypothetical protein
MQWWVLPTIAKRMWAASWQIHISHNGRSRRSGIDIVSSISFSSEPGAQ